MNKGSSSIYHLIKVFMAEGGHREKNEGVRGGTK